jgi:PTS system cellobiose-specific IIB component
MITFTLLCSLGMSTSMLVDKMKDIAQKEGLEIDIDALAFDRADRRLESTDVLLFGPQVRHLLPKFRKQYADTIPVIEAINISDYGLLSGEKILKEALAKLEAAKSE